MWLEQIYIIMTVYDYSSNRGVQVLRHNVCDANVKRYRNAMPCRELPAKVTHSYKPLHPVR